MLLQVAIETQMIEKLTTETRIMIQMQNLLSGGGEKKLQEEGEALAPVCHATECYAFVPIDDATIKQCDALVGFLRAPQVSLSYNPPGCKVIRSQHVWSTGIIADSSCQAYHSGILYNGNT